MIINSFEELIAFIKDNNLKPHQAIKLINQSMHVYFIKDYETTSEVIEEITDFWEKFSTYQTKPLFVGLDLNVK